MAMLCRLDELLHMALPLHIFTALPCHQTVLSYGNLKPFFSKGLVGGESIDGHNDFSFPSERAVCSVHLLLCQYYSLFPPNWGCATHNYVCNTLAMDKYPPI